MSEAIELFKKDGTTSGAFYCSECRAIFGNEAMAQTCHGERFCECGKKCEMRYYMKCRDCQDSEWREKERVKEAERFEAAEKVSYADYKGGMIYLDGNYYDDLEDALDGYLEGQEPEYAWACKDIGVIKASTESLYENILENMWEDADVYDLNGVDALEAAVTAFNEANSIISVWKTDYRIAVLISPAMAPA